MGRRQRRPLKPPPLLLKLHNPLLLPKGQRRRRALKAPPLLKLRKPLLLRKRQHRALKPPLLLELRQQPLSRPGGSKQWL